MVCIRLDKGIVVSLNLPPFILEVVVARQSSDSLYSASSGLIMDVGESRASVVGLFRYVDTRWVICE